MNACFRKLLPAITATLCGLAGAAVAAPRSVEAFDAGTWDQLRAHGARPSAVVFSTTDCVHCPAVIDHLVKQIRQRKLQASLVAVVMDAAPGDNDAALLANPHYRQAGRIFAFAGQAPALRHSVEPRWRGVTPYVVFLVPGRPSRAVTGPPSDDDVDAWVQSGRAAASTR